MQFPQAGQTFQGKYKLLEVLGRGGFAAVYKAIDIEIGREVALKLLMPTDDGYDSSVVARFQREARIIAQLKDPHTITMFDFGRTDDGLLYMVFEYVAGADLAHRLAETGPLSLPIVLHVIDQLLHALREAHEAGVLHRDIKPANVLVFPYLDDDWQVKLLDFGIAKPGIGQNKDPVATLTRAGGIIGTPRYMSPEQLCGEELTAATDIYSLGLVAFEMLVGAPAIAGRDTRDNIVLQLSTDPLTIPQNVLMPPHIRRVLERMMARDVEKRFASARQVIVALRGTEAISGPTTGPYGAINSPTRIGSGPQPHPRTGPGAAQHPMQTPQSLAGLAHSSSGEVIRYPTHTTGQQAPVPDTGRRLPPLALLALGIALGAAIVVPIMLIALDRDRDEPDDKPPRVTRPVTDVVPPPAATGTTGARPVPDAAVVDVGTSVEADTGATVDGDGCGRPAPKTGLIASNADVGLSGRNVVAYVPQDYDPHRRHPVVVVFHDRTRDPKQAIADMKLGPIADREQFIVLAPAGRDYNVPWNPHADVAFIADQLTRLSETYCVDPQLRFGIAHNVGAEALELFACLMPFSAIATTAYRGTDRLACDYGPPVPHIHLVGREDRYHPLSGGSTCDLRSVVSLERKEALWHEQNGCRGKRKTYSKSSTGVCETLETCEAPLVTCILDGGRDWPDSAPRGIQLPGCIRSAADFPIIETVWSFFAKHARPLDLPE